MAQTGGITSSQLNTQLTKMREFWNLRREASTSLLHHLPNENISKEEMKTYLLNLLKKKGILPKLKILAQNGLNNYKTDNKIVDLRSREQMTKLCLKWPSHLQDLIEDAFDAISIELKTKKDQKSVNLPSGHCFFDQKTILDFFSASDNEPKKEKLIKLDLVYFQIPNLQILRSLFKELNSEEYQHIDSGKGDEGKEQVEQVCEDLLSNSSTSAFDFQNLLKFGVPVSERYLVYKRYIEKKRRSLPS